MGLRRNSLFSIKRALPAPRILSLGYPDILVTADDLEEIFGVRVHGSTPFGGWHGVDFPLPETIELFEKLGSQLDCIDIHASRGVEQIVDLNLPAALPQYDLVIDGGTIEHCFHIGQALLNAANAVRPGGSIIHGNPMTMINHGFYNVSPTLMWDFYTQNGWRIDEFYAIGHKDAVHQVPAAKRFVAPPECSLFVVAKRPTDAPLKIPMQSKYLKNPNLK